MTEFTNGFLYTYKAIQILIQRPKLIGYTIIPVIITFFSFIFSIWLGGSWLLNRITELFGVQTDETIWATVLTIISAVFIFSLLLIGAGYLFVSVSKLFSAPFNDLLSEKVEIAYNPDYKEPENALLHLIKTLIPSLIEELKKIILIISGFLLLYAVYLLPVIQVLAPVLIIIYSVAVISIDFVDYSMARRQFSIREKIVFFKTNKLTMLGFGTAVFLLLFIPFTTLFVIQIAVIGGTLLFIDCQVSRPNQK
ncbi:MAG: EI24 domain-containing protein [Calditrichaeota bacterium]|nr:EI24 domain-containing protein [Calditrichota bacterium]